MQQPKQHVYQVFGFDLKEGEVDTWLFTESGLSDHRLPVDDPDLPDKRIDPVVTDRFTYSQAIQEVDGFLAGQSAVSLGSFTISAVDYSHFRRGVAFGKRRVIIRKYKPRTHLRNMPVVFCGLLNTQSMNRETVRCTFSMLDDRFSLEDDYLKVKISLDFLQRFMSVGGYDDGLEDQLAPVLHGQPGHKIEPVPISPVAFLVSVGQCQGITAIWDDEIDNFNADGFQADILNHNLNPSHWAWGYVTADNGDEFTVVRTGSSVAGTFSVEAQGIKTNGVYAASHAHITRDVLLAAGVEVDIPAIDATHAVDPHPMGIYITDQITVAELVNQICMSCGAYVTFSWAGVCSLHLFQGLQAPAQTIQANMVIKQPEVMAQTKARRAFITVRPAGGGAVDLTKEGVGVETTVNITTYLDASTEELPESLYGTDAGTGARSQRMSDIYDQPRITEKLTVTKDVPVKYGDHVLIQTRDTPEGEHFFVLGTDIDLGSDQVELTVWS